jgi:hypothetical protein
MNSTILLKTASVLMLVHFIGHTLGMMSGPSHGPEEVAVIESMKAHHFDAMGSSRSYWDYFLGFGFDASINMLFQAVLLWILAGVARTNIEIARPFIALLLVLWIASMLLYIRYFFLAPIVFAALMIIVLGAAWISTRRSTSQGRAKI